VRLFHQDRMAERAVAVMDARLCASDTARAFDAVAGEYDHTNRTNPILAHMRDRAMRVLRAQVAPGAALLDMGCGPGTDHAAMLAAGYRVTAIDSSPAMAREAQRRAGAFDPSTRPTILCRSIDRLDLFEPGSFDAAFSNFGPFNCIADLASAAEGVHRVLRPGGIVVASVIGRVCPWEIALYVSRGRIGRARLRLRRGLVPVPLKNGRIWTQYIAPGHFERTFRQAGFRCHHLEGLGILAPPPYLEAFALRHPALVARLHAADDFVGSWPGFRHIGDHFLIALRRS
jgi:ubiquinone/menaquinone biosynthesis C-methylase UbiE